MVKQKKSRNWHAVNAHFRKSGAMTNKKKQDELNLCRKWNFNEVNEIMNRLLEVLKTMDIPKSRLQDIHWLSRNLAIRNGNHPDIKEALKIIKSLLKKLHMED